MNYRERLIKKHNAEMDLIRETAEKTGLDECTLFYAAVFGIRGIWGKKLTKTEK